MRNLGSIFCFVSGSFTPRTPHRRFPLDPRIPSTASIYILDSNRTFSAFFKIKSCMYYSFPSCPTNHKTFIKSSPFGTCFKIYYFVIWKFRKGKTIFISFFIFFFSSLKLDISLQK